MSLFETRNVLDRIESAGKLIFKKNIIEPCIQIILVTSLYNILVFGGLLYSFYLFISNTPHLNGINLLREIGNFSIYLLIILLIGILYNGYLYAYILNLIKKLEQNEGIGSLFQDSRISFIRWLWYNSWSGLITLGIVIIMVVLGIVDTNLGIVSMLVGCGGIIYISIVAKIGAIEAIMKDRTSFLNWFSIFRLSHGRWWKIFGNMILVGIVLGLLQNIIQGPILQLFPLEEAVRGLSSDKFSLSSISLLIRSDTFITYSTLFIIVITIFGIIQKVYTTAFHYIVWKDIHTEEVEK